jgi:hypothetical protein
MYFPVWICPNLKIEESLKGELVNRLSVLCDERKDYQENSVVQDIIDPDLYPLLMEKKATILREIRSKI